MADLQKNGEAQVEIGGRKFVLNNSFVEGFKKHNLTQIIKNLGKPILIFHSPIDETVAVSNAQEIYKNAQHPKSFISLDKADHLLTQKDDSLYVGEVIASWAKKYLPKDEYKKLQPGEHQIVASLNTKEDKFTTVINSNDHGLIADEPIDFGGNNYGMSPYDLVTSGLAACTTMTINMYASRKQWPLEEVIVYITHSKEQIENEKVDVFTKEITLKGALDDKQKHRLIEIAAKCPVHKTLIATSKITTLERKV